MDIQGYQASLLLLKSKPLNHLVELPWLPFWIYISLLLQNYKADDKKVAMVAGESASQR